ncbi:MAG: hypothetical protein GW949_10165 [Spirochaetales bacterium]|nr:hypothetical protein [Spirochaetales bacterium]
MSLKSVSFSGDPKNKLSLPQTAQPFQGGVFILKKTSSEGNGKHFLYLQAENSKATVLKLPSDRVYPLGSRIVVDEKNKVVSVTGPIKTGTRSKSNLLPDSLPVFLQFPDANGLFMKILSELFLPLKAESVLALLNLWNRKGYLPFFSSATLAQKEKVLTFAGVFSQVFSQIDLGAKEQEIPGIKKILHLLGTNLALETPESNQLGGEETTFHLLNYLSSMNPHKGRWLYFSVIEQEKRQGLVRLYYLPNQKHPSKIEGELYAANRLQYSYFWMEPNRGTIYLSSGRDFGTGDIETRKNELLSLLTPFRFQKVAELNFPAFDPPGIIEETYG